MSPEDREGITRSIANLWTLQAILLAEIMRAVRDAGALSPVQCTRLLERIDGYADALEGTDDQAYAMQLLATVRQMLASD